MNPKVSCYSLNRYACHKYLIYFICVSGILSSSSSSSLEIQTEDSSDRRVADVNDLDVGTFTSFNIIERNVGIEETTENLIYRAFKICLKSYVRGVDITSRGIVLVKNCFPADIVPSEEEINSALNELWKVQETKKIPRRIIMNESSRHRAVYQINYKNEKHRELECIFGPMQKTVVETINGALDLLNKDVFCKTHDLKYHIRYIKDTRYPSQELISSLGVADANALTKQGCHIDFPFLTAKGMSCFLSASCGTKLEVLQLPEGIKLAGLKASDLVGHGVKFQSIEYDRCDFLIMRGDWPHRGTNYTT